MLGEAWWIPSLAELDKQGIKYSTIIQKPGDVVYTSYGTYHWVFTPVSYTVKLLLI